MRELRIKMTPELSVAVVKCEYLTFYGGRERWKPIEPEAESAVVQAVVAAYRAAKAREKKKRKKGR